MSNRVAVLLLLGLVLSTADHASAEPDGGLAAPSPPARDSVTAEAVCIGGQRPRADGAVQASAADEDLARWNVGGKADPSFISSQSGFHPAARVSVDTIVSSGRLPARSSQKGVLSETAVLAQTRSRGYWPFRLCFEAGLRKDPVLRGKSRVRVTVVPSGRIRASRVLSTELRDADTARCLAARTSALRLSPGPRTRLDVDITIELTPGDAPLPELALPSAAPAEARVGKVDSALDSVLQGGLSGAAACFAQGRARDPSVWGRLGLRIDVDAGGSVAVRQYESRFPDPEVVRCTLAAVGALPLGQAVRGPLSFTWGLRLGAPPRADTTIARAK